MANYATEIIQLEAGTDYTPTFIRTDRRIPAPQPTSLGYVQIGAAAQEGNAKGPIFKVEFADLTAVSAEYIKIWGLQNDDTNAPIYPITYLNTWRPIIDIYLKKFIFCTIDGTLVAETDYTVIGYKKNTMPTVY
jgi:hypothetical protein